MIFHLILIQVKTISQLIIPFHFQCCIILHASHLIIIIRLNFKPIISGNHLLLIRVKVLIIVFTILSYQFLANFTRRVFAFFLLKQPLTPFSKNSFIIVIFNFLNSFPFHFFSFKHRLVIFSNDLFLKFISYILNSVFRDC